MSGNFRALNFIVVVAITLVVIIVVWQSMKSHNEAMTASHDGAYRALAEEATAAARKTAEAQERIAAELVEVRNRIAAIEKLLSEVG
jgi:hypothetical protein